MSPGGLPSTVLPAADPVAEARLADARPQPSRPRGATPSPRVVADLSALPRRLGGARRRGRRHDRALRRLPGRLPPRARRAAGERLARLGLRALVRADERRVPPLPARPAGDGGGDRRGRRGRALRAVPPAARSRRSAWVTRASGRTGGAVLCGGRAADRPRQGAGRGRRPTDGRARRPRARSPPAASRWCSSVGTATGWRRRRAGSSSPTRGRARARSAASIDALALVRPASTVDGVVVAACDLPDLTVAAVRAVAGERGAAPSPSPSASHPALAYWPIAAVGPARGAVRAGVRSLHEALDALGAEPGRRRRGRPAQRQSPWSDLGD